MTDTILRAVLGDTAAPANNTPTVRDRILTVEQLRTLPPPRWLVNGWLDLDSIALVYGRRGSHKSFLAVDLLATVATGTRWHGRTVEQSAGLYVAAEGVGGLAQRFDAWSEAHPGHQPRNLHVLPEAVNLLSPGAVGAFVEAAVELEVKMIVFDTLARCMVGGDENSAKDAGLVIEQLEHVKRSTGACVVVIHHSGKDATAGGRGSSAFEGGVDTVIEVASTDGIVTLKSTKQKNHAEPNPVRLRPVATGESVHLAEYRSSDDPGMSAAVLQTLSALASIEVVGGVASGAWQASTDVAEATYYRHRKTLIALGLVDQIGSEKQPRYRVSDDGALTLSEAQNAPI